MNILVIIFLFSAIAAAEVKIAFVTVRDFNGKLVQLEPNGKFAHIAISYQNKWLHAHPNRGVELVSRTTLEQIGTISELIVIKDVELKDETIRSLIGQPYDIEFIWGGRGFYCSELVGILLKLQPEPMSFDRSIWGLHYFEKSGEFGLSPDDIYRILKSRRYIVKKLYPLCSKLFL